MSSYHAVAAPRRSLESASVWALVATLAAAVFLVIPSASVPFSATKTFVLAVGALVTLALYILARLSRGNIIFPPLVLVGALWLPVIAYALSSVFSGVPFSTALWGRALEPDTLGFMLIATILGTLTAFAVRRPEHFGSFLKAGAIAFAAMVGIQALSVIIGQFAPNFISPAFSLLGSFEDLAFLSGLGIVGILCTIRFLDIAQRTYRILLGSGAIAFILLAIANSSTAWTLVALVSLGFFVEAVMKRRPSASIDDLDEATVVAEAPVEDDAGRHSLVLPLVALVVALFFLIGGTLGGALADALGINVISVRPSWQSTYSVASQVYDASPVFGTGPGTFGAEWLKYRDASLNATIFWNLDLTSGIGFIPTSAVTTGLVGTLAWLAFLGLFLVFGLRALILRTPEDGFVRYVSVLSFIGACYLFAVAIFGLPSAAVLALAFVFAGLFISTTRYAGDGRQWGVLFAKSPRLGFVIVFSLTILLLSSVAVAYSVVGRYISSVKLTQASTALAAGDLAVANEAAQDSLSFAQSIAAYQLQATIANARLTQIASDSSMPVETAQQEFQAALSAGINAALTATRLNPSDYQSWIVLGNLYAQAVPLSVEGAYDSAKAAYDQARELNPTNPQIFYILAQLELVREDTAAAKEHLQQAIALKQDYTPAIFLLSQIEVLGGNVQEALDAALAAAYFEPNNPNVLFQVGLLRAASGDLSGASTAFQAAIAANSQFSNARYLLAAVYAKQGNYAAALEQMRTISGMSEENAKAVSSQIASLESNKNPFPVDLLEAPAPVE